MKKPDRYRIHVDSMLRIRELGYDMGDNDLWIELPNIEGLDEAVILINKAASIELHKKEEDCLEQFIVEQFRKVKNAMDIKDVDSIREIMKETATYYLGRKSCLMKRDIKWN